MEQLFQHNMSDQVTTKYLCNVATPGYDIDFGTFENTLTVNQTLPIRFLETSLQSLMLLNGRYLKMSWKISSGNQNNNPFFINLVIRGTGSARSISSMGGVNVLQTNLSKISVKYFHLYKLSMVNCQYGDWGNICRKTTHPWALMLMSVGDFTSTLALMKAVDYLELDVLLNQALLSVKSKSLFMLDDK